MARNTGRGSAAARIPRPEAATPRDTTWVKHRSDSGVFGEAKRYGGWFGQRPSWLRRLLDRRR